MWKVEIFIKKQFWIMIIDDINLIKKFADVINFDNDVIKDFVRITITELLIRMSNITQQFMGKNNCDILHAK